MSLEQSQAPETTTTSAPAATEDAAPTTETLHAPEESGAAPEGGSESLTQAYTPSGKYKAADKEKEFPDWVKGAIKQKDHEDFLKDVFEKADGLDFVKKTRDDFRTENDWYKQNLLPVAQNFQALANLRDTAVKSQQFEAVHKFFQECNLPEDLVIRYALKVAELREKPEQKQVFDRTYALQNENDTLRQQYEAATQQQQAIAAHAAETMLDFTLQRSDIATVAQGFDESMGRSGSFKEEVINLGRANPNLTIEQAVNATIKRLTWQGNAIPSTNVTQQNASLEPSQPQGGQGGKQVLPNIKGKTTAPTKMVPRSIADLRKMGRALGGAA